MGDFVSLKKLSHTAELQSVSSEKGAGGRNAWDGMGKDRETGWDGVGWNGKGWDGQNPGRILTEIKHCPIPETDLSTCN